MSGLRAKHWSPRDVRDIEAWISGIAPDDLELCAFTIGKRAAIDGIVVPHPLDDGQDAETFSRAYRAGHEVGAASKEQTRWLRAERARLGFTDPQSNPFSTGVIVERAAGVRAFPPIPRRG